MTALTLPPTSRTCPTTAAATREALLRIAHDLALAGRIIEAQQHRLTRRTRSVLRAFEAAELNARRALTATGKAQEAPRTHRQYAISKLPKPPLLASRSRHVQPLLATQLGAS